MRADTFVSAARAISAIALLALVVLGVRRDDRPTDERVVDHRSAVDAVAELVAEGGSGPVTYRDSVPPDRRTATLLASAAAEGREVTLAVPGVPPRLGVTAPRAPVARRRSALRVRVRGEAGERVPISLEDGSGQLDTLSVVVGATGVTVADVAVEPAREGLERWTLSAGADSAQAMAWVRPPDPLRVLVVTDAPGWETRYLVRALESRGIGVSVRQELGRDLAVLSEGGETIREIGSAGEAFDPGDVDVIVSAAARGSAAHRDLDRWVRESGGGLLLLEPGDEGDRGRTRADELTWSGPAEFLPLPTLDLDTDAAPLSTDRASIDTPVATDRAGGVLVAASLRGRGRVLRSGLITWPWILGGGAPEAHTEWWVSVVEWLADGMTDDALLAGSAAQPRTVWRGRIDGRLPTVVTVDHPDGLRNDLGLRATAVDRGYLSFVPTTAGAHPIELRSETGDSTMHPLGAAVVALGTDRPGWAEAALEIGGAGGRIMTITQAAALGGRRVDAGPDRAPWIFLLLSLLMGAGWAVRRVRGLA